MTADAINEETSFAAYKLSLSQEALSDQIAIVFRLKTLGLDVGIAGRDLDKIAAEYRRWQEYWTLLMIRKGMAQAAKVAADLNNSRSTRARFASIDYRSQRESA
jgi:hypothetical protein